jgi:small-conductance mechanosensitive channel
MLSSTLTETGSAALWLATCTIIGLIVDQIVYATLRGRARTRGFRTLGKIAEGLHWFPTTAGFIIGASLALPHMNLTPQMFKTAQTVVRVAGILAITIFSARILSRVVRALTEREDVPLPSGSIFVNLTRGVVWVLGALSILATLGVSIAPLVTALGVGGLAVGLALQPTLENVFSGIQLITSRQIQPGDFIRLDTGDEGTVLDVSWRNTTVRKVSNDVVIVPNSVLARAAVTNFSTADKEFVLLVPVSFASAGDPDAVQRIALDVARSVVADVPGAVKDQEPGAGFAELTPPAAVLNVTVRCNTYQDRIAVRHELIRRLAKRFADEGIAAPPVAYSSARRP